MRKPTICICENKDADQLCSNCTADQRLCFRLTDSNIPLLIYIQSFNILALCCDCTAWFVSDLVGNPKCWFSHAQVHDQGNHLRLSVGGISHCNINMLDFLSILKLMLLVDLAVVINTTPLDWNNNNNNNNNKKKKKKKN